MTTIIIIAVIIFLLIAWLVLRSRKKEGGEGTPQVDMTADGGADESDFKLNNTESDVSGVETPAGLSEAEEEKKEEPVVTPQSHEDINENQSENSRSEESGEEERNY